MFSCNQTVQHLSLLSQSLEAEMEKVKTISLGAAWSTEWKEGKEQERQLGTWTTSE